MIEQNQFEVLNASPAPPQTEALLDAILNYGYYPASLNVLIIILDGGRYINHSFTPNSIDDSSKLRSTALRNIEQGEEIVEDYSHFGRCPWANLYGDFANVIWGPQVVITEKVAKGRRVHH